MSSDLIKRLTIKAGVMEMGEKIAWGSDTSLMREAAASIKELEAKLAKWVIAEYDNGDVISLSGFAGGASEGGAWSTLTLMKEEANGDISFREYKAVKDWEITLAELTGGKDE